MLILDTCEHVVEACAALAHQLLAGCPELRLIATSREPLRVRGETAWRVPPLALPPPFGELSDADLAEHEAIRLFAERAAAVRPGFTLNTGNIGAVVRLCRTLDGIPLAIELAAARIRALSVEQIAGRLSDRFQLLAGGDRTAPPRQQTLRAAVDWSYELLTGPEQVLLRRLSVFSDWNLDMAERICAGQEIPAGAVLGLLAALIDKSLVTLDASWTAPRATGCWTPSGSTPPAGLTASGEGTAVRVLHRDYLLDLVEQAAAVAFVRGDPPWPVRVTLYQRIHAERANFIAALAVSYELGHTQEGLRLCCALRSPWITNGDAGQGAVWCDRFLALAEKVLPGNGLAREGAGRAAGPGPDHPRRAGLRAGGLPGRGRQRPGRAGAVPPRWPARDRGPAPAGGGQHARRGPGGGDGGAEEALAAARADGDSLGRRAGARDPGGAPGPAA